MLGGVYIDVEKTLIATGEAPPVIAEGTGAGVSNRWWPETRRPPFAGLDVGVDLESVCGASDSTRDARKSWPCELRSPAPWRNHRQPGRGRTRDRPGNPGGIDFNESSAPSYPDFAYLALTIGMTFQVSDTALSTNAFLRLALRHALLSYMFGTLIIATTINHIAGLGR